MPDFILLLHDATGPRPARSAQELAAVFRDYRDWGERQRAEGRVKAGQKLTDDAGRVLRSEGGRILVTDGPFAESKELLGGFYVVSAEDYDEACRIAQGCPHLKYGGRIEVRQFDLV